MTRTSCLSLISPRHVSFVVDMPILLRCIRPNITLITSNHLLQTRIFTTSVNAVPQVNAKLIRTSTYKIYESQPCPWFQRQRLPIPSWLFRLSRRNEDHYYLHKLETMNPLPPSTVRGMKVLDKAAFKKIVQVPVLQIPSARISELGKCLNKKMLKVLRVKPIAELPSDKSTKLLLLDPVKCPDVDSFTDDEKALMKNVGVDFSSWQYHDIELAYENWSHSEVLRAILPEESDGVAGFSSVGHILHLNLKDDVVAFKDIIGNDDFKGFVLIPRLSLQT